MKTIPLVELSIGLLLLAGCAVPQPNNRPSATNASTMEWKGPEGRTLPSIEVAGWIESQSFSITSASGTGTNRSYTYSSPKKCDVVRCSDGHDYVLMFVEQNMVGMSYKTGQAYSYKISGQVAVIPPNFWVEKIGFDVNPFENMDNHGVVEKRDVSHMIIVKSMQSLK